MAGSLPMNPTFSSDGQYLFFVSNRTFNPTYGQTDGITSIHGYGKHLSCCAFQKTRNPPFAPKSDEVKIKEEGKKEEKIEEGKKEEGKTDEGKKEEGKKKAKGGVTVKVDADGLQQRITVLPDPIGKLSEPSISRW